MNAYGVTQEGWMSRLEDFMVWMGLAEGPSVTDGDDSPRPRSAPEWFQQWVVANSRAIRLGLMAYLVVVLAVAVFATGRQGESSLTLWLAVAGNFVVVGLLVLVTLPMARRRVAGRGLRRPGVGPPS